MRRHDAFSIVITLVLVGCQTSVTGVVKEDASLTGQTQKLAAVGQAYAGPQYTVGLVKFDNKTSSKEVGLGDAATDILRTLVKQAGLEPIDVTEDGLRQQEELIKLQQTGAIKTAPKSAAEGFEAIDYRIQGAITAYSEAQENSTQVARVQVDYAFVDLATGKSLVAESGMGEYRKKPGLGGTASADVGLRDGALRDALSRALEKMLVKLSAQPFQGRILLLDGQTVVISAGTRSKLPAGARLAVYRSGQDLVDPETGRVIGKREKQVGELTVLAHQNDRVSEARVAAGTGLRPGDIVRGIP